MASTERRWARPYAEMTLPLTSSATGGRCTRVGWGWPGCCNGVDSPMARPSMATSSRPTLLRLS
eukprot:340865-Rhodomonas_salina.1